VSPSDDGTNFGEVADVLYLDQPVGTGFSYGSNDTDLLTSIDDVSREFVNFIDSFLTMYPEYKMPRKIILMGESTAGKYLPLLTKALDAYITQGGQLAIQAVIIGNPYTAGILQRLFSHDMGLTLNIVDENNLDQISLLRDNCIKSYSAKGALANETYDTCAKILSYVTEVGGGVSSFDGRKSQKDWNAMLAPFQNYLGNASYKADIYKALHVDGSTKSQIF
jgi:carboxypeptidase C (cathepsin A)